MIRRPPRSTQSRSSAASDVYKRQERFYDIFIRPELPTANYIAILRLRSHEDHRKLFGIGVFSDPLQYFPTVDSGHHDVKHHEVQRLFGDYIQRLLSRNGFNDGVVTVSYTHL